MRSEPFRRRASLERPIPSVRPFHLLITLAMGALIVGITGCGRPAGQQHAQADCPARPTDAQINALMENTVRAQYLNGSPYDAGFVHWKVDYLTQGQNCQTYTVYLTQYWTIGSQHSEPDHAAQLAYATDGRWRLQFDDKSYQVN